MADTAFRGYAFKAKVAARTVQYTNDDINRINHCVAGNYDSSSKSKRSAEPRTKHAVRSDIDIAEHYRAMSEVWTGKGDITLGGDGFMFP